MTVEPQQQKIFDILISSFGLDIMFLAIVREEVLKVQGSMPKVLIIFLDNDIIGCAYG